MAARVIGPGTQPDSNTSGLPPCTPMCIWDSMVCKAHSYALTYLLLNNKLQGSHCDFSLQKEKLSSQDNRINISQDNV